MISKKNISIFLTINCLIIGIAVWWGGQNTWKLLGFDANQDSTQEDLIALEEHLKDISDEVHSKYNLAVVYYRQQDYKKSIELLTELLNSRLPDASQSGAIHYNLGNALFRLAEQEKDISKAINLLKQSLTHFRIIIEKEKQKSKYSGTEVEKDKDAYFNYVLIRNRLKLLNDKLQKQQEKREQEKQLYQLIKELREKEKAIGNQLRAMKLDPTSKQSISKRDELLQMRKENFEQLKIIEKKLLQSLSPQQP